MLVCLCVLSACRSVMCCAGVCHSLSINCAVWSSDESSVWLCLCALCSWYVYSRPVFLDLSQQQQCQAHCISISHAHLPVSCRVVFRDGRRCPPRSSIFRLAWKSTYFIVNDANIYGSCPSGWLERQSVWYRLLSVECFTSYRIMVLCYASLLLRID